MPDDKWAAEHRAHQVRAFARRYADWTRDMAQEGRPGLLARVHRDLTVHDAAAFRITEEELQAVAAEMNRPMP